MADNPEMESVSKPTNSIQETQQAFANLINNTARSEEPKPEVKEANQDNLVIDNELTAEDISDDELVINEETNDQKNEELFDVKINGQVQKVSLEDLMSGYSKGENYTKKSMELSEKRRSLDTEYDTVSKDKEAVKKMREEYAEKLKVVERNLQTDDDIDWVQLAQDDPSDYAVKKAEYDRKKELQNQVAIERQKLNEEKKKEQEQVYNNFIQQEQVKLVEKIPAFADEKKAPVIMEELRRFANSQGYTDQEINMIVDHRAVITLYNAYRYNKALERKGLVDKKVKPSNRVLSSDAKNSISTDDKKLRVDNRMKKLQKTGSVKDAQKVLSAMLSNN